MSHQKVLEKVPVELQKDYLIDTINYWQSRLDEENLTPELLSLANTTITTYTSLLKSLTTA